MRSRSLRTVWLYQQITDLLDGRFSHRFVPPWRLATRLLEINTALRWTLAFCRAARPAQVCWLLYWVCVRTCVRACVCTVAWLLTRSSLTLAACQVRCRSREKPGNRYRHVSAYRTAHSLTTPSRPVPSRPPSRRLVRGMACCRRHVGRTESREFFDCLFQEWPTTRRRPTTMCRCLQRQQVS